ncbi:VPS9 domain protein [Cordyceps fumosorosea ARSEF 2679]|uniref:VPS9 domain protein n=1 Tax=Cordyceps fumosorosea (strain ARSEF 2679) TaxID=1081104 RepID=A0A167ZD89_CORFA|nr:VPS9 domain protein [Cordyceps fumosorosea ARSEF 2679]OAA67369.1 VPS9 domain protein [Cordyceps fumosorosea ARSEF 2679]
MASANPDQAVSSKPVAVRVDSQDAPSQSRRVSAGMPQPRRAHTFQNDRAAHSHPLDAFEASQDADEHGEAADYGRSSVDLDELPIELVTLTDRYNDAPPLHPELTNHVANEQHGLPCSFIESLSAKVHSTPPKIHKMSQLFQDFYALASSHIQTHISALATRQRRGPSPNPSSSSSLASAASRLRARTTSSLKSKDSNMKLLDTEQQMITAEELADRKKARRALEAKKGLMEEAVERRLCEAVYDRIYRHRSTQDEAQDDKLRSKTAALALVNIGLADLGVDLGQDDDHDDDGDRDKDDGGPTFHGGEIHESLAPARRELIAMNDSHYPLGKINHLRAVHRSIVDTLSRFHPSASADEIMPVLIYTLITLAPEHLHAISNLRFVQHFRWEPKLTGEAAYCLTNFEAAISFLETVDLSTLRNDEHPSGPPKGTTTAAAEATKPDTFPPAYIQGDSSASAASTETSTETVMAAEPTATSSASSSLPGGGLTAAAVLRNRRLSGLVNTPAQAFGAASGAVFSTADQGLKTISSSLGESYSFLIGKLRQQQKATGGHGGAAEAVTVPRTLDEARKLVSTPPLLGDDEDEDEDETASLQSSSPAAAENGPKPARRDSVLALIGGGREPSADSRRSRRSASSLKRVELAGSSRRTPTPPPPAASTTTVAGAAQQQGAAMLDQVRSLGSSFNPMARLPSMAGFRGFGRASATSTTPPVGGVTSIKDGSGNSKSEDGCDLSAAFPDLAAAQPPKQTPRIAPPNRRFMEISTPGELRLGEVLELLRDYRRLAAALKNLDAFEDK